MNQLEDDLHRVLQLARAQSRLDHKARARNVNAATSNRSSTHVHTPVSNRELARQRHRHVHTTERRQQQTSRATLLQSKLQAISAVYGLETAIPKLSDVSAHAMRTYIESATGAGDISHQDDGAEQAALEATLAVRRERYRRHFSGLQAPYGPTGLPTLQCLLDAAQSARDRMARHSALAVGAAVLLSSNRVVVSSTIECVHDAKLTICAERAALLKALDRDCAPHDVVVAMAICSSAREALPLPCGSCREFMAECGDFAVFLSNTSGATNETRSFTLFPHARQHSTAKLQARSTGTSGVVSNASNARMSDIRSPTTHDDADADEPPLVVQDWTVAHVQHWLAADVALPQYCDAFARSSVDGCTLLRLVESDLQLLLGVLQPLHRRQLLVHIDRLKDRELLEHGVDYRQLEDYLAVLDRDRLTVVAELKATFDRLDANRDGFLDASELRRALQSLQCDATPQAIDALLRGQLLHSGNSDARVSFPDFAAAFSSLATQQHAGRSVSSNSSSAWQLPVVDISALRRTFDRADADASGRIDVHELAALFESLAQQQPQQTDRANNDGPADDYAARARAWLEAADHNGDGRVSFSEFVVQYVQRTSRDIAPLVTLFEAAEPRASVNRKPVTVLARALETLFADVPRADVDTWYKHYRRTALLQCDDGDTVDDNATRSPSRTIALSDFVLAVFVFQDYVRELRKRVHAMAHTLSNDALVHRSRVVHLQQSGHVRMCRRVSDDGRSTSPDAAAVVTAESFAAMRRKQRAASHRRDGQSQQQYGDSSEDEAKEQASDSDDQSATRRRRQLAHLLVTADAAFDRFARVKAAKTTTRRGDKQRNRRSPAGPRASRPRRRADDDDDGKEQEETKCRYDSSDVDDTDNDTAADALNALETVQAMTELGIACPRNQMLQLLEAEGVGRHDRCVTRRDFQRLFVRWHAQRSTAATTTRVSDDRADHAKRMADMAAQRSNEYGRHGSRQDYDAYLLRGRRSQSSDKVRVAAKARKASTSKQTHPTHRRVTQRTTRTSTDDSSDEHANASKRDASSRRQRRKRNVASNSSGISSGSSSSDSSCAGRSRGRKDRQHTSTSEQSRAHRRSRTASSQQQRARRENNSNRRRRSSSALSRSSSSSSSDKRARRRSNSHRHRPHQDTWRGLEVGDRVAAPGDGRGTLTRLYRDYFVADVRFDLGKHAKNVDLATLQRVDPLDDVAQRPTSLQQRALPIALGVGTAVVVSYRGTNTVRRGTIAKCRRDGTFNVIVHDLGAPETLTRVPRKHVRAVVSKPLVYVVGARVTVRQPHAYLRGIVHSCRADGTYDVRVQPDKRVLQRVAADLLRPDEDAVYDDDTDDEAAASVKATTAMATSHSKHVVRSDSDDEAKRIDDDEYDDDAPTFARGDRVEARFQGRDAYYTGTIARVCTDGTFDIEYDDGDTESRVKRHFIRLIASGAAKANGGASSSRPARDDDYGDDGFESS